uniref:Pericentrin/AKAP-450 centrosomal targeting domain-containing protein n=2 Tax=Arion vulgaris TaxID=1028688 RepID=A0A0B7BBN1_9EUPU
MFNREAVNTLFLTSAVDQELKIRLSECCSKLQTLASQIHNMTTGSRHERGSSNQLNHVDREENDTLLTVMSELRQLKLEIRMREGTAQRIENETSSLDIGKLREHNQQLAEHILKLKKEKEKLSDSLKTVEKTLKRDSHSQVNIPQYTSDTASDEDSVYDRTIWASERLSFQMSLDSAEHEIQRLRSEIQHLKSLINSNSHLTHTDPDKTSRLYGKYLRAESFRKALIYQKKYLLLLLGGYRDTEQETLAILASMGGYPTSHLSLHSRRTRTRAFTIFRSAGRVIIAVFRMKYLVKKWKRATRVGSPVVTGQINHHHAYVPTSSSYPSHQRRSQQSLIHHQHTLSNNMYTTNSSSSVDHINSLSNDGVSSQTSTMHQAIASQPRPHSYTTPPTKELVRQQQSAARGNRDEARRRIFQDEETTVPRYTSSARTQYIEHDDDKFLQYLENVQQELSDESNGSPSMSRHVAWR